MAIRLDYSNMMAPPIDGGVTSAEWTAFDQPGVELGKQFTYAMLGRADAELARKEWSLLPQNDPKYVI